MTSTESTTSTETTTAPATTESITEATTELNVTAAVPAEIAAVPAEIAAVPAEIAEGAEPGQQQTGHAEPDTVSTGGDGSGEGAGHGHTLVWLDPAALSVHPGTSARTWGTCRAWRPPSPPRACWRP